MKMIFTVKLEGEGDLLKAAALLYENITSTLDTIHAEAMDTAMELEFHTLSPANEKFLAVVNPK